MAKNNESDRFVFAKFDTIGDEDAEHDRDFLFTCFLYTDGFLVLKDPSRTQSIIVGRTGSGKSAMLEMIRQTEEHVIALDPESLSLQWLSNSTVLQYLHSIGVKLDIFYRLLWKHILAVSLIRERFKDHMEAGLCSNWIEWLQRWVSQEARDEHERKSRAIEYLSRWGGQFWENTEARVKEVTSKLEEEIDSKLAGMLDPTFGKLKIGQLSGSLGETTTISSEIKTEIAQRAQDVVNHIQISDLQALIKFLEEDVFPDRTPRYLVTIDKLDTDWVDDTLRYHLIRALVETCREFFKIPGVKVIVALREDLLERVFRRTQDAGFQREKYNSFLFRLTWSDKELLEIVEKRISALVRQRYTKQTVKLRDIISGTVEGTPIEEYLLERTLYRPRDAIVFINECIKQADGKTRISQEAVKKAEADYSKNRFESLGDEWRADFPQLLECASVLKRMPASLKVSDIQSSTVSERALHIAASLKVDASTNEMLDLIIRCANGQSEPTQLRDYLTAVFYQVGLLAFKPDAHQSFIWSFRDRATIRRSEITDDNKLKICPMFFRALSITKKGS